MKYIASLTLVCFIALLSSSFTNLDTSTEGDKINWISWEEALEKNKKNPKKVFVDVYTEWCGWCKKMDSSTFVDPNVVKYMNDNFYAVKFDAEQKEEIVWEGNTYAFEKSGRRGAHQLAKAMLNGRMGYPSFVLLDEELARIRITPGFKKVDQLMQELTFAHEEKYKEVSFEDYSRAE
jgi:thioredoxin-related protein